MSSEIAGFQLPASVTIFGRLTRLPRPANNTGMNLSRWPGIGRVFPVILALVFGLLVGWFLNPRGASKGSRFETSGEFTAKGSGRPQSALSSGNPDQSDRANFLAQLERSDAEETGRIVQVEDFARSYGPDEFQEAAAQAERLPLRYRNAYLIALAAHWAKTDPKEALDFANQISDGEIKFAAIAAALDTWIALSPEVALPWLRDDPGSKSKGLAWRAVSVLMKQDPAQALAYVRTFPQGAARPYSYQSIFETWTKRDPQVAAAAAVGLPPGEVRNAALGYVAGEWAGRDPKAALAWVDGISETRFREELKFKVIQKWCEKDNDAVRAWARQVGDKTLKGRIENMAWSILTSRDPAEARRRALALPESEERTRVLTSMVLQRAHQNLADAIEIMGLLPAEAQFEAKAAMVNSITQGEIGDPRGVCDLALTLPPGEDRSRALSSVMQNWARTAPRDAAAWLAQSGQMEHLGFIASDIAAFWAQNDFSAAQEWVNQLPAAVREQAMPTIVQALSETDPARATELFATQLSAKQQESASWLIATNWARRDFDAAARWAQTLPPGATRDNALGSIASELGEKDPKKAADWLDRIPLVLAATSPCLNSVGRSKTGILQVPSLGPRR